MMSNYNLDLLAYSAEEVEVIEKVLSEYYTKNQVIEFINNGDFILYEGCHTLEDVIKYIELQYGDCSDTVQELDINNIWLPTKVGIILMPC